MHVECYSSMTIILYFPKRTCVISVYIKEIEIALSQSASVARGNDVDCDFPWY